MIIPDLFGVTRGGRRTFLRHKQQDNQEFHESRLYNGVEIVTVELFEQAVLQHRDRVFGFALHFLGNRQEAEDVTQDVLIRLWDNRLTVAQDTLAAWVLRVARNACVDQYRKRRTRNRVTDSSLDSCEEWVASTPDPDSDADSERLRKRILSSMNQLKEPFKSIVILRELQDLSYEEIAEALDLPLTTVKVYLHRGRRTLRRGLQDLYSEFVANEAVGNGVAGDQQSDHEFAAAERSRDRMQTNNQTAG